MGDETRQPTTSKAPAAPFNPSRTRLREMGEPVTLFGEGLADRRDRLRELLTIQAELAGLEGADTEMDDAPEEPEDEQEEEFYSRGGAELLTARKKIAEFSLPRA